VGAEDDRGVHGAQPTSLAPASSALGRVAPKQSEGVAREPERSSAARAGQHGLVEMVEQIGNVVEDRYGAHI